LQTRVIEALLPLLSPGSPFPPFTPEAAANVNELIRCRQWLLHAGTPLLDPHEGYDEAWLHYITSYEKYDYRPESYRTTPSWDLYRTLSDIAGESHPAGKSNERCDDSNGAFAAAKGEIFSTLESSMAYFKVLHTRDRLFRKALEEYGDLISDLEHNVL
jgi:hypothetical protein